MPDQYTAELRTTCNNRGLSCRGANGGYLRNATLERLLAQQHGGGPAAGKQQEDDGPGFDVDAMEKRIREDYLEAVKGDSNEYVWELIDDVAGGNIPDNIIDEVHQKVEQAFHQALLRMDLKQDIIKSVKEWQERYTAKGRGPFRPDHVEEDFDWLVNDVTGDIDYSDPQLLGLARNIYLGL